MFYQQRTLKVSIIALGIASMLTLSGCQATQRVLNKFDNGSLSYQSAQQLDPIVLPADQPTAPFTPLYPVPNIRQNTLVLTNDEGTRYQLPPPFRAETVSANQANQ